MLHLTWMVMLTLTLLIASRVFTDSTVRTLVIGDSITVNMFRHGAFPSNFVELAAYGAGTQYCGQNLEDAVKFYNGVVPENPQIKNCVIILGVNDYWAGVDPATFINEYERIVSSRNPLTNLYCVGVIPQTPRDDRLPQLFYSIWIKEICEANGGMYISPNPALVKDGQLIPGYFADDKIHLSFEGSRALGHYIAEIVDGHH